MSEHFPALIEAALSSAEIPWARVDEGVWVAQLSGTYKLTVPVVLMLRERELLIRSFFMRRPAENAAGVYRMLLKRNARSPGVWFALDDDDDIHLVAQVPLDALNETMLDRVLGAVLVVADESFNGAIQAGFATYLAKDMAWRAKQQSGSSEKKLGSAETRQTP
jgi:putative sensory transduction regulator